jgi:stage V sporulation protein D (sporulation-specific penicillin-binding protein)
MEVASPRTLKRIRGFAWLLALCYLAVSARLVYIQFIRHPYYKQKADQYTLRSFHPLGKRGLITDRNGESLALNADAGNVGIDPSFYRDPGKFPGSPDKKGASVAPSIKDNAKRIADLFGMKVDDVEERMRRKGSYVSLKWNVPLSELRKAKEMQIPGLRIDESLRRVYPMGTLAAHLLGFTNKAGKGIEGLESEYEDDLARTDGEESYEVAIGGTTPIPGTVRKSIPPLDGANITLTIDTRIQQVAERELAKACTKFGAEGGTVVAMDPRTGEILAMASWPTFDPNRWKETRKDNNKQNRAVWNLYEPGSTQKTITACIAVDSGKVSTSKTYYCPIQIRASGHWIHDDHGPYGLQTMRGILAHSSNVGMTQIARDIGSAIMRDYIERFGMLERPGSGIPGETLPTLPKASKWSDHFRATVAFGQSMTTTPLHLTNAYCAIANGGTLMKPMIVKSKEWPRQSRNPGKRIDYQPQPLRTVIRPETARIVTRMLESVVNEGTGKTAKIRGYRLVGKTGSAQQAVKNRGYKDRKIISSFIGFVPAGKPRVVILATIENPKGSRYGSATAAPVFREVARQAVWYLNIPPDDPNDRFDGSDPSTWPR